MRQKGIPTCRSCRHQTSNFCSEGLRAFSQANRRDAAGGWSLSCSLYRKRRRRRVSTWAPPPVVLVMAMLLLASVAQAGPGSVILLIDAQSVVESQCNPGAVGDQGRSRGILQIQRGHWEGSGADILYLANVWSVEWSRRVTQSWYQRNCPADYRLGRLENLARAHNGGKGWRRTATGRSMTLQYWRKCQIAMELLGKKKAYSPGHPVPCRELEKIYQKRYGRKKAK